MPLNYTLHDIFEMSFAILLFSCVLVFPGYVLGWALDIFSFKKRLLITQYIIAIALSNAVVPITLYLAYRFVSNQFGVGIIIIFCFLWIAIQINSLLKFQTRPDTSQRWKSALAIAGIWIGFCIFLLVDIQIGQRLYFNAAAYDFTTRTSLIEAITRTGIPPINPSFYPGHYQRITELYYFWYIPASVVDMLGGKWVDARIALFAGITWTGLSLMATIATYLRIRNRNNKYNIWNSSILGIKLLTVSGLDFIPVVAIMIMIKFTSGIIPFNARFEGWNMPIISWLNAMIWVPNHVASMAACMIAVLAMAANYKKQKGEWIINILLASISISSAFGLSVWVAATFGVFMIGWAGLLLTKKTHRFLFPTVTVSGILGLALVSQFLMEILQSGGKSEITGSLPVGLYVRPFFLFPILFSPGAIRNIAGILLLPVNYFFELGFFFVVGVLWTKNRQRFENNSNNIYIQAEILLLVTVTILLSFVKSTVIALNDLGMRGWLLGQFILLIWAVDILNPAMNGLSLRNMIFNNLMLNSKRVKDLVTALLIVGVMTTCLEGISTRFWTILIDTGFTGIPNELTSDTNLGTRTFNARIAYEYIRDNTPKNLIIQNNPKVSLDRPSGLYGTRQMVISDRTAYGIPIKVFKEMAESIGGIFSAKDELDWILIDDICRKYSIQAIVINDADPIWQNLSTLRSQRSPIYINQNYAIFNCGE